MIQEERDRKHCDSCGVPTLHQRNVKYANHVLHLLLSLVTVGLWLPIWFLLAFSPEKSAWHCSRCGAKKQASLAVFLLGVGLSLVIGIPLMLFLAYLVTR